MFIIDGHEDIAFNTLSLSRDYRQAVATVRALEGQRTADIVTIGLPDALAAGVGIVFGTLFVMPAEDVLPPHIIVYKTAEEAYAQAQEQLAVYRKLAEQPEICLIESDAHLTSLLASWDTGQPRLGIVVLMEGADPIRDPAEVTDWYAAGVRLIGPAWRATRYCGGTGAPGPLTTEGKALIREMGRVGVALDVSHMAEESFWQAIDLYEGCVVASHSNCRALLPGPRADRHVSDAMIKALIERDAVIGVVLYNRFLSSSWEPALGKQALGLDVVIRHIDHICQLAGSARHVAIGSDFDGGFGSEAIPSEIDSIADLPRLADALRAAGFADDDVSAIMGGNWLRKLHEML